MQNFPMQLPSNSCKLRPWSVSEGRRRRGRLLLQDGEIGIEFNHVTANKPVRNDTATGTISGTSRDKSGAKNKT